MIIIKTILKYLSLLFFVSGLIFAGWSIVSLNKFFTAKNENRLPPAGSFIDGPEEFTFAIVSDSGLREEPFNAIIKDIKKNKVKFILHLGDQARRLSNNHFEHILQELDRKLGDIPFYAIPGNHDVLFHDQSTLKYYQRAFGQPNYWFGYGDTLFIALNTSLSEYPEKDRKWLSNVLKNLRTKFKSCILYMHVPPEDPRPGPNYAMYKDNKKIHKIIANYNITAVFCGHIHQYTSSKWGGTPLYTAPASGQELRGGEAKFGYLLCSMGADSNPTVKHIPVTKNDDRDHFTYILSTGLDGITSTQITF